MRVAMYYNNRDIRIEEMSRPDCRPGELIMRVEASGICGSDVMEWYRKKNAPLVLGHEVAGEVVERGDGVIESLQLIMFPATHAVIVLRAITQPVTLFVALILTQEALQNMSVFRRSMWIGVYF